MATVRKLVSGKWNAQVRRKGHNPISKTFINQKDAHSWIRTIESEMDKGSYINRSLLESNTLEDVLIRYRDEITPTKKGKKQEEARIAMWLSHPLAKRSLASLKSVDFVRHRDRRCASVASNTVRLELALLSHLFNVASKEWNIPVQNPLANIRKPKPSNARTRRLEEGEEQDLLSACKQSQNPLLYPIVVIAIETAMRLSELLNLEWKDVDVKKRLVFLSDSKNGCSRTIPLSMRAMSILNSLPKHIISDRLFYTWKPRSDAMNGSFKLAVKKAGLLDFHFHDLRHEATSRLFEKGLNVMEVSAITGHRSLSMLQRYTHIKPQLLLEKIS